MKQLNGIDRIMPGSKLNRITEAAMSSRSSVYRWMVQNHDGFAEALAHAGRPNWEAITAAFAEDGMTVANQKPPTKEAVRQTWIRVRAAVETARARKQAAPKAPVPAVRHVDALPAAAAPDARTPDNPFGFVPGKPKGMR